MVKQPGKGASCCTEQFARGFQQLLCDVQPRPEVLLYALMSPAGCFTDFHVDFGGSSVWYHVVSGRKVFLALPPTAANTSAFEQWASSEEQASSVHG